MGYRTLVFVATLFVLFSAYAADVQVKSAWVRSTVPAQMVSGAFMEITSKTGATLVGVSTPVAEDAEVHEMKSEDGVMKMRAMPRLALPAGKAVTLSPGGYHIMLMGLKRQLKAGDKVDITLMVEDANKRVKRVRVNAYVRDLTEMSDPVSQNHNH
jgi:periplasmic copper chaperone A